METWAWSSWPGADLAAWWRERIVTRRVALLVGVVVVLALAASPPKGVPDALLRIAFVAIAILQLRFWDDLADRVHDRRLHAARFLSRHAHSDAPYAWTGLATVGVAIALLAGMPDAQARIAAYLALLATLGLLYSGMRRAPRRALRERLVLLKYPALLALAATQPFTARVAIAAFAAYAVIALYDRLGPARAAAAAKPARPGTPAARKAGPPPDWFEQVACPGCGSSESRFLVAAEDDLTGKPGRFTFVRCDACALAFQNPRLRLEHIGAYYDDEYIAHRKRTDWGPLKPLYEWTMDKHDRDKVAIVGRHATLGEKTRALDVGCGAGTFVAKLRAQHGAQVAAVDFKDLSATPWMRGVDFRCGLFYEQAFGVTRFDVITMWHFLEHDYEPARTLATARDLLAPGGHLVIEVPRLDSVSWALYRERWPGLQAPQHTVLFDREGLEAMVAAAGLEIVEYLPWGAFPPYFYLFAGAAFKLLRGRGLDLRRAILPYFAIQVLLLPVLLLQRHLNLAMQTVVCRRRERP